jgi:hypothetical protein
MAGAPVPGAYSMNNPNSNESTPISRSSHSFEMAFRRRIAAMISKIPVKIAQNAIS